MITSTLIQEFAELGRMALAAEFAESISDLEVLSKLQDLLAEEAGDIDRVYDVTLDGETFKGKAEQKFGLAKSQVYSFAINSAEIQYRIINAADMAEYAESEVGWQDVVDFAAAKGKKLNCKPGNVQCGGRCQSGDKNCTKNATPKQAEEVTALVETVKAKTPKKPANPKAKPGLEVAAAPIEAKSDKAKPISTESDRASYLNGADLKDFPPNELKKRKAEIAKQKKLLKRIKPDAPPPHPEEMAALNSYTSLYYGAMNSWLRGDRGDFDEKWSGRVQQEIKMATAALDGLPSYTGSVYRGANLSKSIVDQYEPGSVVTEAAFTSTSKKPTVAEDFAMSGSNTPVVYSIASKRGKSVETASAVSGEEEILFKPETKFRVLSKETKDGITRIYMEEED